MEPQTNHFKGLVIALSVVFPVMLFVGIGGTYYLMHKKTADLEKQVSDLKRTGDENLKTTPPPSVVPTKANDKYADWKTYEGIGYSIKYPTSWKILTENNNREAISFQSDKLQESLKQYPMQPNTLNIYRMDLARASRDNNQDFKSWNDFFGYIGNSAGRTALTSTSFAGVAAKTQIGIGHGTFYSIYVVKGNVLYELFMPTAEEKSTQAAWDNLDKTLRDVLDSFSLK